MGKAWALGLAGVVLAFLLGLLVGGWMADPQENVAETAIEAPGGADGAIGKRQITDKVDEVAELKKQNEKLAERIARLQAKLMVQGVAAGAQSGDGTPRRDKYAPMEWPDDTPAAYGPGQFERLFRKVAEESEAEVDIVSMQCNEPPCLMVRRVPPVENENDWGELMKELQDTPTWKENFPQAIGHQGKDMPCGDGRTETVQIIWFTPDEWDEDFVDDMLARRWIRVAEIADNWKCLPAK